MRVTTNFQIRSLALVLCCSLLWLGFSGRLMVSQYHVRAERAEISEKERRVAQASQKIASYSKAMVQKTQQFEMRQRLMEDTIEQYLGKKLPTQKKQISSSDPAPAVSSKEKRYPDQSSVDDALDDFHDTQIQLAFLAKRQSQHISLVQTLADERMAYATALLRRSGINPQAFTQAGPAMGGPYLPVQWLWRQTGKGKDPLVKLSESLAALDQLERGLLRLPSHVPVKKLKLSSGFGFRFDPFTHWPAMHMGQDFIGTQGTPIYAAGQGRIVQAGWSSGYGRLIVIDHGQTISTRYGHLARFLVRPGQWVTRGQIIGLMGSSGRSTGTHLHFELRIQGRAINPVYLMREMPNVFKIQKRTEQRIANITVDQ